MFIKELWGFLKTRKKFWLLPVVIILIAGGLLIAATAGSVVAPLIYTIF